MPLLNCTAVNCIYNKEELCSKGDILVDGESAEHSSDTCCHSFKEAADGSMSNSTGSGSASIYVDCKACECSYNKEEKCHANAIDIEGSNACECEQTQCGTFRYKNR